MSNKIDKPLCKKSPNGVHSFRLKTNPPKCEYCWRWQNEVYEEFKKLKEQLSNEESVDDHSQEKPKPDIDYCQPSPDHLHSISMKTDPPVCRHCSRTPDQIRDKFRNSSEKTQTTAEDETEDEMCGEICMKSPKGQHTFNMFVTPPKCKYCFRTDEQLYGLPDPKNKDSWKEDERFDHRRPPPPQDSIACCKESPTHYHAFTLKTFPPQCQYCHTSETREIMEEVRKVKQGQL